MKYYPYVDIGRCSQCFGCLEIAPEVFTYDEVTGMIVVADMQCYPESLVNEAIKNCPKDCIKWDIFQILSHG